MFDPLRPVLELLPQTLHEASLLFWGVKQVEMYFPFNRILPPIWEFQFPVTLSRKLINSVAIAIAKIRRELPFYSSDSWQPRQFRGLALSRQKYEWKYPKRFCDKQYLEQPLYKRKLDWKYAMTVIWVPTNNTHSHTFCYRHLVKIRYTCWL